MNPIGIVPRRPAAALMVVGLLAGGPAFAQGIEGPPKDGPGPQMGGYGPQGGGYGPGGGGNPLLGAWSWQTPANTGGVVSSTAVYGPDGTFALTFRLPTGMVARYWGEYQAQPAGPNQWRVETRLTGYLPQQVCSQVPGGAPSCQQAPVPPPGNTEIITFTGPNTVQAGPVTAYRDPSPVLAQMQVPAVAMQAAAPPPGWMPGGVATGGVAPGGIVTGGGGSFGCSIGATRCTNGWLYRCEPVGTNTMWKTGAQRC